MKPIVIYGAGGFGREVLELLRDINDSRHEWEVLGFLDDDAEARGKRLNGFEVLGGDAWLDQTEVKPHVALGVGDPATKLRIVRRLGDRVEGYPALVHPNVVMSQFVDVGQGVLITAGNILTTNVRIGDFAMLNLAGTVGHDARIGAYATLSPGVNVSGYVTIGEGCDIGTGVKIVPGLEIGEWSVVGAGAVVARDLPANCTAVGVPAKPIKQREPGWQST